MTCHINEKIRKHLGIPKEPRRGNNRLCGDRRGKSKPGKRQDKAWQIAFEKSCEAHGLPVPIFEYGFHPERKWRFDVLFLDWLALEIQGGLFKEGRHNRGAHLLKEHEKLNAAVEYGYSVIFCIPSEVEDGSVFQLVRRVLESDGSPVNDLGAVSG